MIDLIEQSNQIIQQALEEWKPKAIICLYSGGYDSLVMTHLTHALRKEPLHVYAIDTKMGADGWSNYVTKVAAAYQWKFSIYDNQAGFDEWLTWVKLNGCPRHIEGHKRTYNRLKGRAIEAILQAHKTHYYDKILFLSGIRKAESRERNKLEHPINRMGKSNAIFANPLFYWQNDDITHYRLIHDLPPNPFYETVGGSGDCQCNWGNFITLQKLRQHAPNLANGNVAQVNAISRQYHSYGWDEEPGQKLFNMSSIDEGQFTAPFLCSNCSRAHSPAYKKTKATEDVFMDRMFEL